MLRSPGWQDWPLLSFGDFGSHNVKTPPDNAEASTSFPNVFQEQVYMDALTVFSPKSPLGHPPNHDPATSTDIEKFGGLESPAFQTLLSSSTSPALAVSITEYLRRHVPNGSMSAFSASVIQPFTDRYAPWPLLKWREGDDTDVMAIFKVESQQVPCSCLLHYGVGRCFQTNGNRWKQSSVAWVAASIDHLLELFVAACHITDVSQGSEPQFVRHFVENSSEGCSKEEFVPHVFLPANLQALDICQDARCSSLTHQATEDRVRQSLPLFGKLQFSRR
jgi:hypothetical protein